MRTRIREALQLPALPKFVAILTFTALIFASGLVRCDVSLAGHYDRDEAWNPLRVAATAVYPVGYVFEKLVILPLYHLGQKDPFYEVFGQDTFDESYD